MRPRANIPGGERLGNQSDAKGPLHGVNGTSACVEAGNAGVDCYAVAAA